MDEKTLALIKEIAKGVQLTFENAEKLYNEATLLGRNGAFARCVCLHQISIEECSKVDSLGAGAMQMAMGFPLDFAKFTKRLREHKVKNFNNAYMSKMGEEERAARERGDDDEARRIFKAQQQAIHDLLNGRKNESLYVDYRDGEFVAPGKSLTEAVATEMQALNGYFLRHAQNHVHLLERLLDDTAGMVATVTPFLERVEAVRQLPPEQQYAASKRALNEWVAEEVAKHLGKAGGSD